MTTTENRPRTTDPIGAPILDELPLPPLTLKSAWASAIYDLALCGGLDDPGHLFAAAGPIVRGISPRVRGRLQRAFPDVWMDNWTGEYIYVSSPKVIQEIYDLPPGNIDTEAWKKSYIPSLGSQSPFMLRGTEHAPVRRALVAELTPARVESYRERSVQRLDEMIDELPLHTPVNLHDFYTRFTQDVILRVVFGWDDCGDLEELKDALYVATRHYFQTKFIREAAYMLSANLKLRDQRDPEALDRDPAPFAGRDDRPPRFLKKAYRLRTHTDALLYRKIAELRANPNDSVASRIIAQGAQQNPPWSEKRLRDIIGSLVIAGHETSVLAYAWATQYIMHDPEVHAKVTAEARNGLTDRYAQACNTEALRMRPPVIASAPSPLKHDISLAGYRIRKGTLIFVMMAAVHYNEKVYDNPHEFRPERWLEGKPERYGFVPFGTGPHRCPGSTFYLTEASIVTQRIFGRLDLEPCRPRVDRARFIFGTLSRPKSDTEVIISRRRPASEVPWYRPCERGDFMALKEELLLHSESSQPPRCPHLVTETTVG